MPRPTRPPSAQRRDQHRRDDPRQLHRQRRRVAEVGVNGVIERRDDVPDADAVDEGAKADVLAPEPEFQQEKQDVRAQVLGAQRDAEQLRQPHVQGADGVVAEVGLLEKRNAKGDDDDARHHAHHPPGSRFAQCGAVHRGFSFSVFSPIIRLLWAGDKLFMEGYNDIRVIRLTPLISPQSVLSPAPPRSR